MKTYDPIITDFDDNDAYKFFMQYAVFKNYPDAKVSYSFILRDTTIIFPDGFAEELKNQIDYFKYITITKEIEEHLFKKLPWFDNTYRLYLRSYRYDPSEVSVEQIGGVLKLTITGYWHKTIMWEVPLLATISELYYRMKGIDDNIEGNIERWKEKIISISKLGVKVSEFGLRRRKSKNVQDHFIKLFLEIAHSTILGTSNVMMARKYNIKAIGTQAHEWYMFHAAKYGVLMANRIALGKWADTYHGALGIALSDTFTSDVFLRDFDLFFAKLFDGVRQDSGDPLLFIDKVCDHYFDLRIILPNGLIPKTIIFSDSIDSVKTIKRIEERVNDRILTSYGIGTWFSNDLKGVKPINMVIKITGAYIDEKRGWKDCVKLSDSKEKYTGNKKTVDLYKKDLGI
jgi:nicotinate phosphoribosyltransferase